MCAGFRCDGDVLKELAEGTGKVVYKPNCKGMGKGVRVLPVTCAEDIKDALDHIRNGGNGIIEEYICQDNVLSELNPSAVSVVAILFGNVSILNPSVCAGADFGTAQRYRQWLPGCADRGSGYPYRKSAHRCCGSEQDGRIYGAPDDRRGFQGAAAKSLG